MPSSVPPGLALWLSEALPDRGPFAWRPFTAGTSNETYKLIDAEGAFVLQRPPAVARDRTAHDVVRQFRLLRALEDGAAPAPRPVAVCEDTSVLGSPFLVVEFIDGITVTTTVPDVALSSAEIAVLIGHGMVDALARIHGVDWRAAGLADFGRPDGFLERQVPRWSKQYERARSRDLPHFSDLARWLEAHRPPSAAPAILHGDFHLANCLVSFTDEVRIAAVIDWEMATIGDPLLDLGEMLVFWGLDRPSPPAMADLQAVSRVPGSPTRAMLAERYAAATGRSIEHLDYYLVLSGWKLAAIMEGAYAHARDGGHQATARWLERDIPLLLAELSAIAG